MEAVVSYFTNLATDFNNLEPKPHEDRALTESKVASLFLRVMGGVLAVMAVCCFVSSLATLPVSPLTSVGGMAASVAIGVLAHDLIKIGDNKRRINMIVEDGLFKGDNFVDQLYSFGKNVYEIGRAAIYEARNDISYVFRDTIIFDALLQR